MTSIFACDFHGTRVPARLETAYPSLVRGGARYTRHMRLCSPHMTELLELPGLKSMNDDPESDPYNNDACTLCGQVVLSSGLLDPLFITAYRHGEDRSDFFALVCAKCGDQLVKGWKLTL